MRKIAANYICLPGFPLVKNGYVILEQGRVKDVVDTGGRIREIQGLEFYGGLIVAAYVTRRRRFAFTLVGRDLSSGRKRVSGSGNLGRCRFIEANLDKQDEISFIINEGPKVGFRTFGSPHSSVKISEKNYFLSLFHFTISNSPFFMTVV